MISNSFIRKNLTTICVTLFLIAIVAADLVITHFGPKALPFTAFFLIPFDLVTRDILHEKWKGKCLWPKIGVLVLSGGIISYLLNQDALNVAKASVLAFACATFINTVIYQLLYAFKTIIKMNVSNLFAAITDSVIFPFIAFGVLPLDIMITQSLAKFGGGILWSTLFVLLLKEKLINGIKINKSLM